MREGETYAQAEARYELEGFHRSASSYRADAKRLEARGDLEEAAKYRRWAAEEEQKLAGGAGNEGPVR